MGSDVEQIFRTANLHRDHSILHALVCEKELSQMDKTAENLIRCARKKCDCQSICLQAIKISTVVQAKSDSDILLLSKKITCTLHLI